VTHYQERMDQIPMLVRQMTTKLQSPRLEAVVKKCQFRCLG